MPGAECRVPIAQSNLQIAVARAGVGPSDVTVTSCTVGAIIEGVHVQFYGEGMPFLIAGNIAFRAPSLGDRGPL